MEKLTNDTFPNFILQSGLSVIKVGAAWCGPCKVVEPILIRVNEKMGDVNIAEIDAETENDLSNTLSVRNIPTTIFYKNGEEIDRHIGAFSESLITELIEKNKQF